MNKLRDNISGITNTGPMKIVLYFPPIFIVIMIALIAWFLRSLPPQIPLYYSRPWGEDQLATPILLFILPLGSLLWYLCSLLVIGRLIYLYRVFSQMLLIMQVVSSGMALLTIINILHLVL